MGRWGLSQSQPDGPLGAPARCSPGHTAGRAPVHLPGGIQIHLHRGGGAAWSWTAGRRRARGHRDGHGGGGGGGRRGGGRSRGGRRGRSGLGQLGGRWLLRQRLLLRWLLLGRLGDPRAPLAAAAPGATGTTARPSAFRHGLARGRGGAGLTQTEATPSGSQASLRGGGSGGSARLRPPGGARAASESARTRGPSLRAVLALARRRLLRPARPRHWVGVSERGGEPRSHPAGRQGAGPAELSPAASGEGATV